MFVPLSDTEDNPTKIVPVVCYAIVIINILVYFASILAHYYYTPVVTNFGVIPAQHLFYLQWGTTPQKIFSDQFPSFAYTLITSMFVHGGFYHILGNLWFFRIMADNIEETLGHVRFLFFYLFCGLVAVLTHSLLHYTAPIPYVGASGAIAGVMGAYLALFPRVRFKTYFCPVWFYIKLLRIPSVLIILVYFVMDVIHGISSLQGMGVGVAHFAHIGGLLAGFAIIYPFRESLLPVGAEDFTLESTLEDVEISEG
jgi:membrane associated rhomboid family serine protease